MRSILVLPLLLAGCSGLPLAPYKIDIQQGNAVTQEMVSELKLGMTRAQVRFILGTPLVADVFHANRWDYVYRDERAGKLSGQRALTVFFEEDRLSRVTGDVIPAAPAAPPGRDNGG